MEMTLFRMLRLRQGISQKKLGKILSLSPGYVSRIERQLLTPARATQQRIAEALGSPVTVLFPEEEKTEGEVSRQ